MFERLDAGAGEVLEEAVAEARRLGHNYLGTEHLLVGFLVHVNMLSAQVRAALPVGAESVRAEMRRTLGGPGTASDAVLLATLGIDLDEVRRRAEATFGPSAMSRAGVRRP